MKLNLTKKKQRIIKPEEMTTVRPYLVKEDTGNWSLVYKVDEKLLIWFDKAENPAHSDLEYLKNNYKKIIPLKGEDVKIEVNAEILEEE